MPRQERDQVRLDADRPHAGTAAAVWNAERLVQIEVADVGADVARPCQSDQRVEVGAVEIDLPAVLMRDRAEFAHRLLEHAVGRGIGDHAGGEPAGMLLGFGAEISDIDVAIRVRADHDDGHARTSERTPDWCRAPTPGSGKHRDVTSPRLRW